MNHPSDLKLEEHLLDRARHADHIGGCGRCQARLSQMEEEGRHFRQYVYPATLASLEKQARRPWAWLLAAPVGLLAAAAVVVVAQRPASDYEGTKGMALKLTVYTASRALNDGDQVPASASLRFRVHTSAPCTLTLLSIDDTGAVSRIHQGPARGDSAIPGGAVLDGRPGSERFVAVCTPGSQAPADLEQQLKAGKTPSGSTQASVLLKKRP